MFIEGLLKNFSSKDERPAPVKIRQYSFHLVHVDRASDVLNPIVQGICENAAEWEYHNALLHYAGRFSLASSHDHALEMLKADQASDFGVVLETGNILDFQGYIIHQLRRRLTDDVALMGHILDRTSRDGYFEVHPQFYVVNLKVLREFSGRFSDRSPGDFNLVGRSTSNFHDDYTPIEIWKEKGKVRVERPSVGSRLLSFCLEHGKVMPFTDDLRQTKFFLYPDQPEAEQRILQILDTMTWETFYPVNTEVFPSVIGGPYRPIGQYYGVCSGLKPFLILKSLGMTKSARLVFFDKSQFSVDMYKKILFEWDGRDYVQLVRSNPTLCRRYSEEKVKEYWKSFLELMGGMNAWLEFFAEVKRKNISVIRCDLFAAGENFNWVYDDQSDGEFYMWGSNIFHYRISALFLSLKTRIAVFEKLIGKVRAQRPDAVFDGDTPFAPRTQSRLNDLVFTTLPSIRDPKEKQDTLIYIRRATQLCKLSRPLPEIPNDYEAVLTQAGLGTLRLNVEFPAEKVLEEVKKLKDRFVTHRGIDTQGWRSLVIHGISPSHTECATKYGYKDDSEAPYQWTEISELCPETTKWIRDYWGQFYKRIDRVRFMLLEPGGYISPHIDVDGPARLRVVNIAVNQPERCYMALDDRIVPWKTGDVRMIDISRKHAVFNASDEDRYHIIVHGVPKHQDPAWQNLVIGSYLSFKNSMQGS